MRSAKEVSHPRLLRLGIAGGVLLALLPLLLGGAPGPVWAQASVDYDTDNDQLIEVRNLEQLLAISWDRNADGTPNNNEGKYAKAFPNAASNMGCKSNYCTGYELMNNLDFTKASSYASNTVNEEWTSGGDGWPSIGDAGKKFNGIFEGNGKTISNLYIPNLSGIQGGNIGLFAHTDINAVVRNVHVRNADVSADGSVGAIVGFHRGTLHNCSATGEVHGRGERQRRRAGGKHRGHRGHHQLLRGR